jgi:hypothetical protein
MADKEKPSFKEWLTDRNITFIIISILVIYALERFSKNIHTDVVTPMFHQCLLAAGCEPNRENRPMWQKIILHVTELAFTVVVLYLISRFLFKHGRVITVPPPANAPTSPGQFVQTP